MVKVLFVCLGNICRSPTAHGIFARQVENAGLADVIIIDSAGTSGWHKGSKPDSRSMAEAKQQGYDLSFIRSRQVTAEDFAGQDYILAMDQSNLDDLLAECPPEHQHKVKLFLDFAEGSRSEVPDPYYGGDDGFADVLRLVEQGGLALLDHMMRHHFPSRGNASD
ncbi:low molecular weight protein-tyrosine-phosphatase [Endozoicomonas montiporae]|uniref:protein-tyrosine-phosphatase n=1 Tax=Endozoicomonas montiporae CL-33 TaxID=570277 RepID=A0A142BE51_9GAMM|nr:low molecular weight protein-tyrosine-phosphatase [Endozoicomonas montiporae]AMO57027.1 protein tyrosine phosphatase [Endozoicomonas montiporae CL-33]